VNSAAISLEEQSRQRSHLADGEQRQAAGGVARARSGGVLSLSKGGAFGQQPGAAPNPRADQAQPEPGRARAGRQLNQRLHRCGPADTQPHQQPAQHDRAGERH
jgi:hypothetical protein